MMDVTGFGQTETMTGARTTGGEGCCVVGFYETEPVVAVAVAVGAAFDVRPTEEEVAALVTVADVLGPAPCAWGEDPQAAAVSSAPSTRVVTPVLPTDVRIVAPSRRIHCRSQPRSSGAYTDP